MEMQGASAGSAEPSLRSVLQLRSLLFQPGVRSPANPARMSTPRSEITPPTRFLTPHPSNWGRRGWGGPGRGADGSSLHVKELPDAGLGPPPPSQRGSFSGFVLPDNLTLAEAKHKPRQHPQPFLAFWVTEPSEAAGSSGAGLRRACEASWTRPWANPPCQPPESLTFQANSPHSRCLSGPGELSWLSFKELFKIIPYSESNPYTHAHAHTISAKPLTHTRPLLLKRPLGGNAVACIPRVGQPGSVSPPPSPHCCLTSHAGGSGQERRGGRLATCPAQAAWGGRLSAASGTRVQDRLRRFRPRAQAQPACWPDGLITCGYSAPAKCS